MEKICIYPEQVTEVANSLISIEEETLKCYQAVGNVYESCWIHFSDITDVIFNKKKQAFLIQITEDPKRKSEICVNSVLVEENLFEVRGGNYKRQEFLVIFQRIIPYAKSVKDIDIALVEKEWAASVRTGKWSKIIPCVTLGGIIIIQMFFM